MKKALIIGLPILLLAGGGGVFFAAKAGVIPIPGLSPAKKQQAAAALYGETDGKVAEKKPPARRKVQEPEPEPTNSDDPSVGIRRLAAYWDEMKVDALVGTVRDWKSQDLAPVLLAMSPEKVSKLLDAIAVTDPKRASELSRSLQSAASKPDALEPVSG